MQLFAKVTEGLKVLACPLTELYANLYTLEAGNRVGLNLTRNLLC